MSIFITDTFTDTNSTALASHTGELGATWAKHPDYTGATTVYGNRIYMANSSSHIASGTAAGGDIDITVDFYCVTDVGKNYVGAWMSTSSGVRARYIAGWNSTSQVWEICKLDNTGTVTQIASWASTVSAATNYAITFKLRTASQQLYVDGTLRASATDTSITWGAGGTYNRYGTHCIVASTSTTGMHLDNFNVDYKGSTVVTVTSVTASNTIPAPAIPTNVTGSSVTATGVIPSVTVGASILILADPVFATNIIPDVIAGQAVIPVSVTYATGTIPSVTVTLPCIVYPTPVGAIGVIIDPYVVAGQKSILLSTNGFPGGKIVSYKIVDDTGATIQNWTNTGVTEEVVDASADFSDYYIRTNKVNENFQGFIHWKTNETPPSIASETLNVYQTYIDILWGRVTAQRATNLDHLDANVSSVGGASLASIEGSMVLAKEATSQSILTESQSHPTLAEIEASTVLAKEATVATKLNASAYTAPDNAGIAALPTLASIEASTVLAKEATVATLQTDVTFLLDCIRNKKYLSKVGSTWHLIIRNSADTADIINKVLKDKLGNDITDITAGNLNFEMKTSV